MKKYLLIGIACSALIAFIGEFGCGPKKGPCGSNINCPKGQYCVAGKCQTDPPQLPKEPVDEKPADTQADASVPEPKPEPQPEPSGPVKCSKSSECKDENKPHCHQSSCVAGYATADFSKPMRLANLNAPSKRCTSNAQCAAWQACSQGTCRLNPTRGVSVTGRVRDEGISLTDYSFAHQTVINGKRYIRILMSTNFSDRLDKELTIDILISKVKAGATLTIDGKDVRVRYYNKHIEFVPAKNEVLGEAIGGSVRLTQASTEFGKVISGTASIIFK